MFIISAGAGLGNQMFEYAFYMKLKKVYKDSVIKVDTNYAFTPAHNGYEVESIFGLHSDKATYEEVMSLADLSYLQGDARYNKISSKIRRKLGIHKKTFIDQGDFTEYIEGLFSLDEKGSYYLYGPFANSKYFEDIKDEVVSAYAFPEIDEKNRLMTDLIMNTDSVSIHVRRGDYIDWGVELLGNDYYSRAIGRLTEIFGKEKDSFNFFVFSDDLEAARGILGDKDNIHYVTGNEGARGYRDMQLMSLCKHNIISNSTFGFWGAYLNKNNDKIVIGPNKPFTGFKNPFTCDGWKTI